MRKFMPGDRIKYLGAKGTVKGLYLISGQYETFQRLQVKLDSGGVDHIMSNSKSLKRLKKKVPKKVNVVERWVNVYSYGESSGYKSEKEAEEMSTKDRITCIKLTGSYESEE